MDTNSNPVLLLWTVPAPQPVYYLPVILPAPVVAVAPVPEPQPEEPKTNCVICFSELIVSSDKGPPSEEGNDNNGTANALESQLNVVFVLRNIFEIRPSQLQTYLRKSGHPGEWVKLCGSCNKDVNNLRNTFGKVHDIRREFERERCKIQKKIHASERKTWQMGKPGSEDILLDCRRAFHRRRKGKKIAPPPPPQSPFLEGDKKASELAVSVTPTELKKDEMEEIMEVDPLEDKDGANSFPHWSSTESFHDEDSPNETKSETLNDDDDGGGSETDTKWTALRNDEDDEHTRDYETSKEDGDEDKIQIKSKNYKKSKSSKLKSKSTSEANAKKKTKKKPLRKLKCPFCQRPFLQHLFQPFSKHLQDCAKVLGDHTPVMKCTFCNKWQCSSSNDVRGFMEHVVLCREYGKSQFDPWQHAVVKCNLCEDACYIPFPEYVSHVYTFHKHRYSCTKCPVRGRTSAFITRNHWLFRHKDLGTSVPVMNRYKEDFGVEVPLPQIPWWCPVPNCYKEFFNEESRDEHLKNCEIIRHESELPSRSCKCSFCNREYFTEEELQMHRVIAHGWRMLAKAHKCEECDVIFKTSRQLRDHERRQHGINLLRCDVCAEEFVDGTNLNAHLRLEHGNKDEMSDYTCKVCNIVFSYKYLLRQHRTLNHNHRPEGVTESQSQLPTETVQPKSPKEKVGRYPCSRSNCKRVFSSPQGLGMHLKLHDSSQASLCSFCGKQFSNMIVLRRHIKVCQRLPARLRPKCGECGLTFGNQFLLKNHKAKVHGGKEITGLRRLRKPNVKEKPFPGLNSTEVNSSSSYHKSVCTTCGKRFANSVALEKHVNRVHLKLYEAACPICSQKLSNFISLKKHMKGLHGIQDAEFENILRNLNSSEDPKLRCKACDHQVISQDLLDKHVAYAHQNKFTDTCELCGKGFITRGHLEHHKARCHKIGDFKCDVDGCKEVYWRSALLEKHKKYKHEGVKQRKDFACQFCGKCFVDQFKLKQHEEAMHTNRESKPFKCDICAKTFATKHYLHYHLKHTHKILKKPFERKKLRGSDI